MRQVRQERLRVTSTPYIVGSVVRLGESVNLAEDFYDKGYKRPVVGAVNGQVDNLRFEKLTATAVADVADDLGVKAEHTMDGASLAHSAAADNDQAGARGVFIDPELRYRHVQRP